MPVPSANLERYSRQVLFSALGEQGQRRLAAARVAIVGCGALGTSQAELLARAGVGALHIVDRDAVEPSNLQRQTLFEEADAESGLPKAIAAERRLARINSDIAVRGSVEDVTPANIAALLDGSELVLDGTDNFETRYLMNDYCVAQSVPWIYGAAVGSRGMTFTVLPGETACLACVFGDAGAPNEATCDTTGVLGWAVALVAALQVSEAVKLLVGDRAALRGSLFTADVWSNEFRELAAPARDVECRACGRRDFVHLRGEGRAAITLCGRNAVQIHEHQHRLALDVLAGRLRAHGKVRDNAFALRFAPGAYTGIELTIFPDGRALIQGTQDTALARSLYARYVGS